MKSGKRGALRELCAEHDLVDKFFWAAMRNVQSFVSADLVLEWLIALPTEETRVLIRIVFNWHDSAHPGLKFGEEANSTNQFGRVVNVYVKK